MKAIEIKNLNKIFPNGKKAVNNVSYSVEEGDFVALLGANGAGKTTTINILTGLAQKSSGEVSVFGVPIPEDHTRAKALIGVVPQEFNFGMFETPEQILYTQAGYYGVTKKEAKPRVEEALKRLTLWDKRHEQSRTLSGGMKRRLMIARALVHEPKLLILDEPTAGVDVELRRSMWEYLQDKNKQGMTILLTTHYLEEAEQLCKKVVVMDNGAVVADGNIADLLTKAQSQFFVFETNIVLSKDVLVRLRMFKVREHAALQYECELAHNTSVNTLMSALTNENVNVLSIRPRANRLEEFFVQITQK